MQQEAKEKYSKRCPYKNKCFYGAKCKFWHPERAPNPGDQIISNKAKEKKLEKVSRQTASLPESLSQTDGNDFSMLSKLFEPQDQFDSHINLFEHNNIANLHSMVSNINGTNNSFLQQLQTNQQQQQEQLQQISELFNQTQYNVSFYLQSSLKHFCDLCNQQIELIKKFSSSITNDQQRIHKNESKIINQEYYSKRCPYKKKCTFGAKCKFLHPERGPNQILKSAHQSIIDKAREQNLKLEILFNKQLRERSQITNNGSDFDKPNEQEINTSLLYNNNSYTLSHKFLCLIGLDSQTDINKSEIESIESVPFFAKSLKITNKSLKDEVLFDKLIKTNYLIGDDSFIIDLIEKCVALGLLWELAKETLRLQLIRAPFFEIKASNSLIFKKIDFEMIIDVDNFIEELIIISMQVESSQAFSRQALIYSDIDNEIIGLRDIFAAKFNDEIADKVLNEYKEETDLEKVF